MQMTRLHFGKPFRARDGYTLLELLLALSLSIVVVAAITTAISVYLVNLKRQQRSIEQKQVARSVLLMIGNDIRAGLQYKAIDVSGVENLAASQALIAGIVGQTPDTNGGTGTGGTGTGGTGTGGTGTGGTGTGGTGTGGTGTGGTGTGGTGTGGTGTGGTGTGGAETGSAETEEEPAEDEANYRPALIGDSTSLSMDISRLPRLDQYHAMFTGGDLSSQTGSDVKTVSYVVSQLPPATGAAEEFEPDIANMGGLYRRQIDRAVAAYRGEESAPLAPDENSQLVAPEIVEIQFRYFDGSDWVTSWDSNEAGGFPVAIETTIILDPNRTSSNSPNRSISINDILSLQTYRNVVHLPAAELPPEEEGQ